jgi:hypothetical protein
VAKKMKIFSISIFYRQLIRLLRPTYLVLAVLMIASSCDAPSKETPNNKTSSDKVPVKSGAIADKSKNYETIDFDKVLNDEAKNLNAEVSISYPSFFKSEENYKVYNELIEVAVTDILKDYILEKPKNASLETLSEMFLDGYKEFKMSFPESKSTWYLKIISEVSFQNEEYTSIAIETSSYTGGAHANSVLIYLNITSKGKKIDDLNFFFKNDKKVKEIAELAFRKNQSIQENEQLSDKGFLFDDDKFAFSETFGFTAEGLILYYNPYEISSYSEGAITVIVPFSDLKECYRF